MLALPHKRRVCAVPFPRLLSSLQVLLYSGCFCMRVMLFPQLPLFCTLFYRDSVLFLKLYACFALQTSGLCRAIPSTPFDLHAFLFSVMFLHACFASQTSGLLSAIPSALFSLHAFLYLVMFLYACFASQTSGLFSAIFGCTLYYVFYYSVMFLSRLLSFADAGLTQYCSFRSI